MTVYNLKNSDIFVGTGFEARRLLKNILKRGRVFYLWTELPEVGKYSDGSVRIYGVQLEYLENSEIEAHWLTVEQILEEFRKDKLL